MTIYIDSPKRVRIAEEANGSFETDLTGTLGNFMDCPFIEGSTKARLMQPFETPGHLEQHIDGYPLKIQMPMSAEMDGDINIETLDVKAGSGITAAQGALGRLLKIFMGGERLGVGTTITTGATTTSLPVTSASGIFTGTAIAVPTGPGGTMEIREVKGKSGSGQSGNTLFLKLALSSAPADGADVKASATYYLSGTDGSQTTSLQAIVEGLALVDRYVLRGGQMKSMTFDALSPGGIPRCKLGMMFTVWDYADGAAVAYDASASTLGLASYTNVRPHVIYSSEFRSSTVGTTTLAGTLLHAPTINFKPNIKYTAHRTPFTRSTVKQWIRDRSVPVISGGFSLPEEDKSWYTARTNRTSKAFFLQIGSSITEGGFLLSVPTAQITEVMPSNVADIHAVDVGYDARLDEECDATGISGTGYNLVKSTFRVHLI